MTLPESLNAREDTAVAPSNGEQRKPRLLVILGAGSSISCGMPSVREIDKSMRRWAREWKPEPPVDSETDVFNLLWDMAESYYGGNRYCIRPNYEMVLGEMTALASWVSPPPFGNPLIRRSRAARLQLLSLVVGVFRSELRAELDRGSTSLPV